MKKILLALMILVSPMAFSGCNNIKLDASDEVLFAKKCSDFCILKALSTDAREYISITPVKSPANKIALFFLDSTNTIQNSFSETSDFFKIYSSDPKSPNKASIFKYDKISKVFEIIQINSLKIQPESHQIYTCLK